MLVMSASSAYAEDGLRDGFNKVVNDFKSKVDKSDDNGGFGKAVSGATSAVQYGVEVDGDTVEEHPEKVAERLGKIPHVTRAMPGSSIRQGSFLSQIAQNPVPVPAPAPTTGIFPISPPIPLSGRISTPFAQPTFTPSASPTCPGTYVGLCGRTFDYGHPGDSFRDYADFMATYHINPDITMAYDSCPSNVPVVINVPTTGNGSPVATTSIVAIAPLVSVDPSSGTTSQVLPAPAPSISSVTTVSSCQDNGYSADYTGQVVYSTQTINGVSQTPVLQSNSCVGQSELAGIPPPPPVASGAASGALTIPFCVLVNGNWTGAFSFRPIGFGYGNLYTVLCDDIGQGDAALAAAKSSP